MTDTFLKIQQVADILHLQPVTIRKHMKAGLLGYVKLGSSGNSSHRVRIRESDLDRYIKSFAVAPKPESPERAQEAVSLGN